MNVKTFVVFPSASPSRAATAVEKWRDMGYQAAVYFNPGTPENCGAYQVWHGAYKGYWDACNYMAHNLVNGSEQAQIVIFAADDIDPDPNHPMSEIAGEFAERFPDFFGVMQPCGDKQGIDKSGKPAAARICGSPWIGAGWVKNAYGGRGPTNPDYFHFYGDEELFHVAERYGVLWMRPDLLHFHHHWSWGHSQQQPYQKRNSDGHWEKDKALYQARAAAGFSGSGRLV